MTQRMKKVSGRVASTTAVTIALGLLLWAILAYAGAGVTLNKTQFARGGDTVISTMSGGIASGSYAVEYYGPSANNGTDLVLKTTHTITANTSGGGTDSYATQLTDTSGNWEVRYLHNPNKTNAGRIVIDGPTMGTIQTTTGSYTYSFHVEDRNGNTVLTSHAPDLAVTLRRNTTRISGWRGANPSGSGWSFTNGVYSKSYTNSATAGDVMTFTVAGASGSTWSGAAAETGDTWAMGALSTAARWIVSGTATTPYTLVPYGILKEVDTTSTGVTYLYTFDMYGYNGAAITTYAGSWTRSAKEAAAYDGSSTQTSITSGTVSYVNGHWQWAVTVPAPGKWTVNIKAGGSSSATSGQISDVINFDAETAFTMLGDTTPPGEVSGSTATPSDNAVAMTWNNPTDSDFRGVIITYNTNSSNIDLDTPNRGQTYSVNNLFPNGSRVVYKSDGGTVTTSASNACTGTTTSMTQGGCGTIYPLPNNIPVYYRLYTYDTLLNYSAGTKLTATPFDTTPPGPATNVATVDGNQTVTINWTYPTDCDIKGAKISYRTDTWPSKADGSDCEGGAANQKTANGAVPGGPGTYVHQNLVNGITYYYTIWTYDDDGNVAPDAQGVHPPAGAAPHDTVPPAAIDDLRISPLAGAVGAFSVKLEWSSVGNDGRTGQAQQYEIRYANTPITDDTSWKNAWHTVGAKVSDPLPGVPSGTWNESYVVAGLSPLKTYYFAIKTMDAAGNWSPLSTTTPSATTLCNQQISGCNQCHLLPPDDDLPGAHPRGTGNIGAHYLPIHAGNGTSPEQCDVCHANGQVWRNNTTLYQYTHQDGIIEMNNASTIGNLKERQNKTGGTWHAMTTIVYKYKNYSSGVGYKVTTGYCVNTYCHGNGLSSPQWGIGTATCGEYCHETPPATGKHVKHYHPGLRYINFGPSTTPPISGYENDPGTTANGWSANLLSGMDGNPDLRYASYVYSTSATKTFSATDVPNGTYYITVCVGKPDGAVTGQTVSVSTDGGATYVPIINNFGTSALKLFKKAVDQKVLVYANNGLIVRIGNGSVPTYLNFMILNPTPEAPTSNTTLLKNTATEYGFSCGKCHVMDITQAKHTSHVNGAVQEGVRAAEVYFDGNSFPKNPLGNYTDIFGNPTSKVDGQGFRYTVGRSCLNLYCHGNTLNAGGSNTTPHWTDGYIDVQGASICGSCHDAGYGDSTPNSNIATGSHNKHVNRQFAYRFDCAKCHNHTVGFRNPTTGAIKIIDKTHHVNGQVDVIFDPNDRTMALGNYSAGIKTCNGVYCHSNGQLNRNGDPFWATKYAQPVWGSGSKTCNFCHGNSRADGAPDYANNTTTPNSHPKHVDVNGLGCSKCHNNTTRDNGLTIYTTARLHVNGSIDLTFDSENPSAYYTRLNATCSGTYCHKASSPKWGRPDLVNCGSCHGNFAGNPNPATGAHNKHNLSNHTSVNSSAANNSTATQYDFSCFFCHYSRTHGGGEFKLHTSTAETNFNTITPLNGYNNTGATYVTGNTIINDGSWHYTNGRCFSSPTNFVKCHQDGKGNPPNNTFFTWTSHFNGCANCHNGTAADAVTMSTGAHGKHLKTSVYRYTCGDCHSATATDNNITNKANHVNGRVDVVTDGWGGGYTAPNCSNIACHTNGGTVSYWKGMSVWFATPNWSGSTTCTSCHSNTHTTGGTGDGTRPTDAQTLSGPHGKHLTLYGSRIGCATCHNQTAINNTTLRNAVPTTHNNGNKDIVFWTSSTTGTGPRTAFFNMTGPNTANPLSGYWGATNYIAYKPYSSSMTCSVVCHSNGVYANLDNPIRMPNWSTTPGTYGCSSCHAADPASFALPDYTARSFAHVTHLNNGLTCSICHRLTAGNNNGTPFINASGYASHHVNGTVANDVQLSVAGSYATATKTCSGLACHGTRTWTTHYASNCSSCHDAPPRYSQHFAHYSALALGNLTGVKGNTNADKSNATNYMFGCGKCHDATQTHHNSGNVSTYQTAEVKFDAAAAPANPLGSYTTLGALLGTDARGKTYTGGTCRNLYCHSNGQTGAFAKYSSIKWSTTSVTCTSCHGGAAAKASVTLSAPHGTHVGTDANGFGCVKCHKQTVSSSTAILYKFNHVNGTKDVYFQAFGSVTGFYTNASQTCRNTYCHSDGNGNSVTMTWAATTTTCTSCHNYTAASGTPMASGKHGQHINNGQLGNFACAVCHDKTVNGGSIIYSNGYHVNGVKNVNFTSIMPNITGFYVSVSKTCRSNYCHSSGQAASGTLPNRSTPVFRVTSSWSTTNGFWCNSCHGRDNGQSSFGEPNYTNRSTVSRAWFNGHGKHVKSSADCQKCHNSTVDASGNMIAGTLHLNGARNVNFRSDIGGTYDTVNKRCTNVSCHGSVTVRWGGKLASDCQSCHSDQGAGSYGTHGYTGKHQKHTATYGFACEACHVVRDPSGDTTHAGGDVSSKHAAEVRFRSTSSVWKSVVYGSSGSTFRFIQINSMYGASGTPTYTPWTTMTAQSDPVNTNRKWTEGRCSNVWCHSNANPVGGTNTYVTYANWSTAETTNCRSCHAGDATASPTMSSGKHTQHINNGTLGAFGCKACHNLTVSSNTAIGNYNNHVNGAKDVYFAQVITNVTGFYTATRSCRNNYCHSSGQAASGTLPNRSTPVFRTTAAWDSATTYTCNACHGQDNGPSTYGEPNYANRSTASRAWFNGHYVSGHVSGQTSCFKCHANVVASDGITILNNGNHLNGFRNVSFTLGGKYDTVNKRCSNTDAGCHGTTVMRWGGTGTCDTCHQVTTAETDNYVYNDGTRATINYYEYTSVGHGKVGNYRYTGNPGAANSSRGARQVTSCTTCHSSAVAHGTPTNPFRLVSTMTTTGVCANCHAGTQASHHSKAVVTGGDSTWLFTPKCVDCHDPHGDADPNHAGRYNAAMIQGYVNYSTNSSTYAVPAQTKAVSFPANASLPAVWNYTSFVSSTQSGGSYTGLCQICHTRGATPTSPDWFGRDKYKTVHNNGLNCVTCHTHPTGFSGSGTCDQCHQTTGAETDNYVYGNGNKATINFYEYTAVGHGKMGRYRYTNNTGASGTLNVNRKITACTSCHSTASSHGSVTNPFRTLSSSTIKPSSPDTLCANCHAATEASGHRFGITTSNATWLFTPKCVDCHDPHGDTGANGRYNNAMIQGYVNYSTNSSTYGVPAQTRAASFPANAALPAWTPGTVTLLGYTSYVTSTQSGGSYTGLCQICHTRGAAPTSPDWFGRDKNKTVHNNGLSCAQCHKHPNGFSRSGSCQDCHQTTTAETDDFLYGNNVKATINYYQYTSVGHGKLGKYRYTNNTGAANSVKGARQVKDCTNCHSSASSHGSATNPFRTLSSATVRPSSPDTLCASCHTASQAFRHSSSISGADANWLFFPKCVDCHDPHGDADPNYAGRNNAAMIAGYVNYTSASSAYGVPAGANGSLRRPVSFPANPTLPSVLLNRSSFTVYVQTGNAYTGLCQICHTRGAIPTSPDHFNRGKVDFTHNAGSKCDDCHTHDTGFAGAGGTCDACHGVTSDATTETDDFVYNNGTRATVNMLQYTSVGHGKMGRYRYSNNTGASGTQNVNRKITACTTCHDSAVAHGTGTNPFRLKNADPSALCTANCHLPAEANHHNSSVVIPTDATWLFTPKCVDCHDPHGDADPNNAGRFNAYMIQSYVNYSTNSSTYGVPAQTRKVSFPANAALPGWAPGTVKVLGYTSFATSTQSGGSYTGLCQICHTRGASPTSPLWFGRDKNTTLHNNGTSCESCHKHNVGFSGAATCDVCHQVTTAETNDFSFNNGTKATINLGEYTSAGHGRKTGTYPYSGSVGAADSTKGARQVTACTSCHNSAVSHGTATNPFRLASSMTTTGVCANCHAIPGTIAHHTQANTGGNANWLFTPKCVDCHDPHGDSGPNGKYNAYMIQGLVNYTTNSSAYGVPGLTKAVNFPANAVRPISLNWTSYVSNVQTGTAYSGLCQICHTRGADVASPGGTSPIHYNRAVYAPTSLGHNANQLCTNCHKHSTGFQGAGDCTGCHNVAQGTRRNIQTDFNLPSHHTTGTWANMTKNDCAACHAEGNYADGSTSTYHTGQSGHPVYLKRWTGAFPAAGTNGTFSVISTSALVRSAANTSVLTPFCLGCHNETNANATPFHDGNTPETYSWDRNSIDSKYSNVSTTPWGKFNSSLYNVVPADQVTKSFSPHGNAGQNRMTKSLTTFATYSATSDIQCYDCHNSHGSPVTGGTSYTSANTAGGNLYAASGRNNATYTPAAGGSTTTKNAYSASADMCFDCHLGESGTGEPKNYRSFGIPSGKAIVGYYDRVGISNFSNYSASRWSTSDVWRGSFAYKDAAFKGGHFGNSVGYTQMTGFGTRPNGNCTACHDPHGVSPIIKRGYTKPVQTVKHIGTPGVTTGSPTIGGTVASGDVNRSRLVVLQITAQGLNTNSPSFRYSTNGGVNWTAATGASTILTSVTVSWNTGNYYVNDTWTFLVGANPDYMVPALKGTWMHSPYKEDRAPRSDYTTLKGATEATARLSAIAKANDYTAAQTALNPTTWFTSIRYWDDVNGGTSTTNSSSGTGRQAGGPAPRANPDFKTGSYIPGYNIPAVIGDGFGQGMNNRGYGSGFKNISSYRGWNGFFIDDNTFGISTLKPSSNTAVLPTNMSSVNPAARPGNFAGLCLQCHVWAKNSGQALSNISSANLATGGARVTTLPHETVSGMATITKDLMTRAEEYSGSTYATANKSQNIDLYMHGLHQFGTSDWGSGTLPAGPAGQLITAGGTYGASDPTGNGADSSGTHFFRWGLNGSSQSNAGTIQARYHQFPCSKCHTPHVSRLPRLLKTNCLDNDNVGTAHTTMGYVTNGTTLNTTNTQLWGALTRNMACHSTKVGSVSRANNTYYPGGWNNKTPW